MKLKHMTYAILIYYMSIIFGVMSIPFLSGSLLKFVSVIILIFWFKKGFKVRATPYNIVFFIYLLLMVLSLIYTRDFNATKQRVITNAEFLVLLIATVSVDYSPSEIHVLKDALRWCSRITALLLLMIGGLSAGRLLLNGSFLSEDPNYLNGYFLFGIVGAMEVLISSRPTRKQRLISIVELSIYIYCCLATGSRGGLFCLISAAGIYFILGKDDNRLMSTMIKKIGLVIVIIIAVTLIMPFIPQNVLLRFTRQSIIESNGTHRYEFWGWAFNIFKKADLFHKLFGYGAGTIRSVFGSFGYLSVVTHNLFVEQLVEGGILLDFVYICGLIVLLRISYKRRDYFSISVLIGFVVLALSTSLYAFKPMWAIMMFINLIRESEITQKSQTIINEVQ